MEKDVEVGQPTWSLTVADWAWLEGGYAIPSKFFVPLSTPRWEATIEVEVAGGKARTRRITMTTEEPGGVTYTMMQQVPIRMAVARAALNLLRRTRVSEDEKVGLAPFTLNEAEEAYALLEKVVGYMDPAWLDTPLRPER
jgi:hypothetical protein